MKLTKNKKTIDDMTSFMYDENEQSIYTGDENSEIARISRQNEYLNKVVAPYLNDVFSHFDNPDILDVGCADGSNILLRLAGRKYHSLLGIDRNSKKIEYACNKYQTDNICFECCDISSADLHKILSEYLGKKQILGFDIIHISSVLLHLKNPGKLLEELKEYLSENGRIFIQDEDDGINLVYPNEECFDDCFYVWNHSIEAGDRHMARKIPNLLAENGYSEIKIYSSTLCSADFNGEMKDRLWDMYFNSDLWVADNLSFYDNIEGYERFKKYKERHKDLKEKYLKGRYFIMLGVFFFSAKK